MSDYENVNMTPDYENVKTVDLRGWVAQRAADQVANDSSFKESWVVEHLAWFDGVIAMIQAEAVAEYRAEVRKQEREETAKVLRNWAKHLTGEASK